MTAAERLFLNLEVFLFLAACLSGITSALAGKCRLHDNQSQFEVKYWDIEPYISKNEGYLKGVFGHLIKSLNISTPMVLYLSDKHLSYPSLLNQSKISSSRAAMHPAVLILPVEIGTKNADPCLVEVITPQNLAYIVRKNNQEPLKQLAGSFINGGQVIGLTLILTGIAGICIWLLDRNSNPIDFPASFIRGSWQGFWWAFVTMTTVGYGDLAPKSLFARLFSILWMLLGLVAFSVLTANFTSSLSHEIDTDLSLLNKKVAVLRNSLEREAAVQNGAQYHEFDSIQKMMDAVLSGELEGMLLNSHIAVSNDVIHKTESLEIGRLVSFAHAYGVKLIMSAAELCTEVKACVEEFVARETFYFETLKILSDETIPKRGSRSSRTLFEDWEFFVILIGLFSAMTGTGVLWEYFYYRPREMKLEQVDSNDNIEIEGQREQNAPKYILTKTEVGSLCRDCCTTVEDIYREEGRARLEAISSFNPLDGFQVIGAQLNAIPGVSQLKRFGAVIPLPYVAHAQKKRKKKVAVTDEQV
ncbi:uncharacterized protein LOC116610353 [Nematostella vectensis]|uniref:uncharacterized protein LOC116610353 n=1 Tax=Nematostella vectensis TaxID=45351 RepID=UPI002077407B|nr:uncharacterized protein LOC116610353 [Nematostella vectensis]